MSKQTSKRRGARRSRTAERGKLRLKRSALKPLPVPTPVTPSDPSRGIRLVLEVKKGVVERVLTDARVRVQLFLANFDSRGMFTRGRRCAISQHEAILDAAAVSDIAIIYADASRRPSAEQTAALKAWKEANGRKWRSKLLDAWSRAGIGVSGYAPELQQLRNGFGPEWLMKQR
jgi:hypothetical protein